MIGRFPFAEKNGTEVMREMLSYKKDTSIVDFLIKKNYYAKL